MKTILILLLFTQQIVSAQFISFTWNTTPLNVASIGPNGSSISSSATAQNLGGTIGYALNPGLPVKDINLLVTATPSFDVNSIMLDLYFRREESVASFYRRGSVFDFGENNGWLYIIFTTTQGGVPGTIKIQSGNIITVADDHVFHRYRFGYDNNTGIGRVWVDNTIVYTYTGTAGRPLDWTGAGNVIIGENMDGTGRNIPILGGFTVGEFNFSTLPVSLLSFEGTKKNNQNLFEWSTAEGFDVAQFILQRSMDASQFTSIQTISAATGSTGTTNYQASDASAMTGINYYRLKLIRGNNSFYYSKTISINFVASNNAMSIYPNPVRRYTTLTLQTPIEGNYHCRIYTMQGKLLDASVIKLRAGINHQKIDLTNFVEKGILLMKLDNKSVNWSGELMLVKN